MGNRKRWGWNKVDWDEQIRNRTLPIYDEDLLLMNSSELVEILNLRGVRAHRGQDYNELVDLLQSDIRGETPDVWHPLDYLRRRLLWFIETRRHTIRDQLLAGCDCQCHNKHDSEVLCCYNNNSIVGKAVREDGYKD